MNKFKNSFIAAALEELQQEQVPSVTLAPQTPVSEVDIDQSKDAVAELMEKNVSLQDENVTLEAQTFDNDVEAVSNVADTVNEDLGQVVKASAALEALSQLCNHTVKAGLANKATLAGHVFALEQIFENIGLSNPVPALESEVSTMVNPSEQTEAVAEKAKSGSEQLIKRLLDGIKRIIGWIMNVIRNAMARSGQLAKRAEMLYKQLERIDESKSIDSKPFIASLRMTADGGDVNEQFNDYGKLASVTLFGFFSDNFKTSMERATAHAMVARDGKANIAAGMVDVLKKALEVIFTEHGTEGDISAAVPENAKDLTVGLTKPCIGGLQLYLAATMGETENFYCSAGVAKNPVKLATPETIPVVDKKLAKDYLHLIATWSKRDAELQSKFNAINSIKTPEALGIKEVTAYLNTLSSLVTGTAPHLMRLNLQNSASFIAYVEKSISVSGTAAPEKE